MTKESPSATEEMRSTAPAHQLTAATEPELLARHPLPLAGLLAVASLPIHWMLPHDASVMLAGIVLAMIAGIYVGFALLDGRRAVIIRECTITVSFTAFAVFATLEAPMMLPLGYIAHGLWDAAHHRRTLAIAMPRGYIPFCAAYDVLAGLGLWWIWMQ